MTVTSGDNREAWQLRMFQKTLKKKLRLKELTRLLGTIPPDNRCLLVTCGDNNGAINFFLSRLGGRWSWADLDETNLGEMSELLQSEVQHASPAKVPFPDGSFDIVISIDVHEHIEDPIAFTSELRRVAAAGGKVCITVPGGNPKKLANRLKRLVGMTTERYGHRRDGFEVPEIGDIMSRSGIRPTKSTTYSRFFTELAELAINFAYVKILAPRSEAKVEDGVIAPQTERQLASVKKSYRAYSLVYPAVWLFSQLDKLVFFTSGYVVLVAGEKAD